MKTSIKKRIRLCFFILCFNAVWSQSGINTFLKPSDSLNIARRNAVIILESTFYIGGIIQMNKVFDKEHLKGKFHFEEEVNSNYLYMDKAAHITSSYHIGAIGANAFKWSGVSRKNQLIYGAGFGFVFLSSVEFFDGYANGASSGDIIANAAGTSLYVSQELLWKEQRIVPKFSFHSSRFMSATPRIMRLQVENEFDGQTYWLSTNLHSFSKGSIIPKWMNIALGYGVEGVDYSEGSVGFSRSNGYRQLYLSLDVDLTRIKTKSHFLRTFLYVFNSIKIPAPTIEFSRNKQAQWYFVYF